MQSLVETGLMLPIIDYQFDRGMDDDAMLNIVFCFFPFLTELGSVQRFIKGGIQPETTKSLSEKLSKVGGFDAMKNSKTGYQDFMDSLSGSELMLWKATCEQFSTEAGAKEFKEALQNYIKKNDEKILSDILGKDDLRGQLDDLTAGAFSKTASAVVKANPIKGTGILAQFVRVGLPVFGAVVGFKKIYSILQSHGYSDEQSEKIANELKKALENDPFSKKLVEIDEELFAELSQKLLIDYVSDKNNTDNILSGLTTSPEIAKDLKEKAIEGIIENQDHYNKFIGVGKLSEVTDVMNSLSETLKNKLKKDLVSIGDTDVQITDIEPLKKYKLVSKNSPNSEIIIKKPIKNMLHIVKLKINDTNDIEIKPI